MTTTLQIPTSSSPSRSRSSSPLPSPTSIVPLDSQVGGHPGVLTTEDGSLLIKPALPAEVAFYQTVLSDAAFEPLRPYVPHFMGTLRLEGQLDEAQSALGAVAVTQASAEAVKDDERDEYLPTSAVSVLENLAHHFHKPNIMDIKLGKVLYDADASEEKRARMIKTALATTSHETGIRLTGFQVYDIARGVAINTPKSYGKSIKASELPEGVARFFRCSPRSQPPSPSPSHTSAITSEDQDKSHTNAGAADEPTPADPEESVRGTGLPPDVLLPLLESLREDVADVRGALAQVDVRMVGASLLVVYEADWARCREGLRYYLEGGDEQEDEEDDSDEDEDEDEEEDGRPKKPCPYVVKLIDFAHTRIVPGQGPDEGVLAGMDTVLRLLDGRIQEVKALLDAAAPTNA
ncbi:hypothetical protein EIP86_002013 [Pleurotus ostreatoroseus]|nr:hypothetical protein EIP86_002013 [Pleurotus ostreatoroseus]